LNEAVEILKGATGYWGSRYAREHAGDVKHSLADIRQAKECLGYEPFVQFREGVWNTHLPGTRTLPSTQNPNVRVCDDRCGSQGRKYALNMSSTPLEKIAEFDCVVIVTDHSQYDYSKIVENAKLVVDTRNATKGIVATNIVQC
jgi:hypothetical protein